MSDRFMRKGITRFFWLPAFAGAIPAVADFATAIELSDDIAEVSGFSFANSPISTPDMGTTFTKQIEGEDTAADSSLTFYENKDADQTVREGLVKGDSGVMVIFPTGTAGAAPAALDEMDIWPAKVSSNTRTYSAGNEAAQFVVNFTIREEPDFDVAVAA